MRTLFFGTPELSVPYLEWLCAHTQVVGVICRQDEPVGRGYKITAPPVKDFALSKNLSVFQPEGPWTTEFIDEIKKLNADVGVAVAYGRILPPHLFLAPRHGSLNIHFSLLPKYRGAAPIQWSLINGDSKTGVTAFWLEEGLDSGPICRQSELTIEPADTVLTLRPRLISLGVDVLSQVMGDIEAGRAKRDVQQGDVTLAPPLKKDLGRINWADPARKIANLIRGVCEWPGASTFVTLKEGKKLLKVHKAEVVDGIRGTVGAIADVQGKKGFVVATGNGGLLLAEVQPEGKKPMSAWDFWNGARLKIGDLLI